MDSDCLLGAYVEEMARRTAIQGVVNDLQMIDFDLSGGRPHVIMLRYSAILLGSRRSKARSLLQIDPLCALKEFELLRQAQSEEKKLEEGGRRSPRGPPNKCQLVV